MRTLTVLFDANCNLCCRIRNWLQAQTKYVDLDFVAAGSAEAAARYPLLDHAATLKELTVVSDTGEYWRGAKAWLICLWALRDYRGWAIRFSSPELMPLARRFVVRVSSLRFRFGYHGT
ncbi:MAG TPA: DCC1-like thiol-disulfide oxidoreductase family protein [Blastocatellia bacterium]|nr:DCC1-like thiol-disulfide oxidoreductase family protein [Blastocatellia bacterium]